LRVAGVTDEDTKVSIRDYVDSRFRDQERATVLALETVKVAMEKDDRKIGNLIALVALVVSILAGFATVYLIAKHG